jgi:hypothetical protein
MDDSNNLENGRRVMWELSPALDMFFLFGSENDDH